MRTRRVRSFGVSRVAGPRPAAGGAQRRRTKFRFRCSGVVHRGSRVRLRSVCRDRERGKQLLSSGQPANAIRTRPAKGELCALADPGAAEESHARARRLESLKPSPNGTIVSHLKSSCQKSTYRRCRKRCLFSLSASPRFLAAYEIDTDDFAAIAHIAWLRVGALLTGARRVRGG